MVSRLSGADFGLSALLESWPMEVQSNQASAPGGHAPEEGRMSYVDRRDGGRCLAQRLVDLEGDPNVLVVGLPRGGVPVAAEVASALRAPLDVIMVRKLGVP